MFMPTLCYTGAHPRHFSGPVLHRYDGSRCAFRRTSPRCRQPRSVHQSADPRRVSDANDNSTNLAVPFFCVFREVKLIECGHSFHHGESSHSSLLVVFLEQVRAQVDQVPRRVQRPAHWAGELPGLPPDTSSDGCGRYRLHHFRLLQRHLKRAIAHFI